jgi:hypothetical protein
MTASKPVSIKLIPLRDILQTNYGADEWLVENIIPLQTIGVISGAPENYKSWICLSLALSVAERTDFLGQFKVPFKRKIAIFDRENQGRHIQSRIRSLGAPPDTFVFFNFDETGFLDDDKWFAEFLKVIKQEEIGLVVFDALIRFHSKDENAAREMAAVFGKLKAITNAGANVIFTHHHRKDQLGKISSNSLRGSSDIFAAVDWHFALEYKEQDDIVVFNHLKARQTEKLKEFSVKLIRDKETKALAFEYLGEFDRDHELRSEAKEVVLDLFTKSESKTIGRQEILTRLGKSYKARIISAALNELVEDDNKLTKENGGHGAHFYSLIEATQPALSESPSVEKPVVEAD